MVSPAEIAHKLAKGVWVELFSRLGHRFDSRTEGVKDFLNSVSGCFVTLRVGYQ